MHKPKLSTPLSRPHEDESDELGIGKIRITKESEDTDMHDGTYDDRFPFYVVEKNNSYHFVVLKNFGYTLEDYLQNHHISTPQSMDMLSGVFYLHTKSIAHRDLRASNVLIRRGDSPSVKNISDVLRDPFFWDSMMRMNFLMHASDVVHGTSNSDLRRIAMGLRVDVFNFLGWRGKVDAGLRHCVEGAKA
ncbi:cell division cycle 2-like protein [Tanacetum coccineum]